MTSTKYITQAYQEPNIVTGIDLFYSTSPVRLESSVSIDSHCIDQSSIIEITAIAHYTSGASRDIFAEPETSFSNMGGLEVSINDCFTQDSNYI